MKGKDSEGWKTKDKEAITSIAQKRTSPEWTVEDNLRCGLTEQEWRRDSSADRRC